MRWLRSGDAFRRAVIDFLHPQHTRSQTCQASTSRDNNTRQRPSGIGEVSEDGDNPIPKQKLHEFGSVLRDDFADFRARYSVPKHPIVLAHGLMGFDELCLAGRWLPGVQYWRGIKDAMQQNGMTVITTSVPTTGSIQERAEVLHDQIKTKLSEMDDEREINIIAHSMGGLDSRHLISNINPSEYRVRSLTTIASPHRGSCMADWIFREIGHSHVEQLYRVMARLKIDSAAFGQLTRNYVTKQFNPCTVDSDLVRYFSYGASATPSIFSIFRFSHDIMMEIEGPNDGLVSVASSKWGKEPNSYKGTLIGVTHLDLINWTNRLKRLAADLTLMRQDFNAIAFYLAIADMLANEGL